MVRSVIYQIFALASFFVGGPVMMYHSIEFVTTNYSGEEAFVLSMFAAVASLAVAVALTTLFTGLRDKWLQSSVV